MRCYICLLANVAAKSDAVDVCSPRARIRARVYGGKMIFDFQGP